MLYCLLALLNCFFTFLLVPNAYSDRLPKATGKFVLFTDFHIDNHYDPRGDPTKMCHWNETNATNRTMANANTSPGPFGTRSCDSPLSLVNFMVKEAQKQLESPDYVIWTGDNAAHDEYDEKRFFDTLESANSVILSRFPDAIVIPVVGNHESVPGNDFTDNGTNNFAGIFERWKNWIGESAKDTFLRGGYYLFRSPLDNSSFLVLNTNFYYVGNKVLKRVKLNICIIILLWEIDNFEHPEDPAGQFAFLEYQLKEAKRNNGTVHILAHIPIGAYEMYKTDREDWKPEMSGRYNQRLYVLFVKYAPWIGWMLFGHLHTDTFRIIKSPDGSAIQRMFLNPAVTPLTFFVNLEALNANGDEISEAKFEYSFRQTYGIQSPLNAKSLDKLVERMKQNETLFDQYFNYSSVQWMTRKLNETERKSHLCVVEFVDFDQLERCINPKMSLLSFYVLLLVGSLFVISVAFLAAFFFLPYIRKKMSKI
ncbi:hypothetical protein niasHS_013607 [Heterodera schachtii]|uniref:Calcineurin-like phosphoesterase domain-containing protein n=1 Tax=Heterodera schachtii TaxID=97005 RepID=A0ABD2IB21_HETSC